MAGPTPNGTKRDIKDDLDSHRIVEQGKRYWSGEGSSTGKRSDIPWGRPGDF